MVLHEPLTALKIAGLAATLAGVLLLAHQPARYGVPAENHPGTRAFPARALAIMAIYVGLIGIGAFLEKPALKGLDATQLNALMAVAMTGVAVVALALRGHPLPMTQRTVGAVGVGAIIGVASVFYFLGLRGLPVSVAAAGSNAYVVVTVLLSSIVLHQRLTRTSGVAVALTLLG